MIDLAVNYESLAGERCWGCSQRPLQFHVGLLEITLLVCGILTALKVGPFASLSSSYTIAFFTVGGALFVGDLGGVLKHALERMEKKKKEAPLLAKIQLSEDAQTKHTLIDLDAVITQNAAIRGKKHRVYAAKDLTTSHHNHLAPMQYLLYFNSSSHSVRNVYVKNSQGDSYPLVEMLSMLNMVGASIFPSS